MLKKLFSARVLALLFCFAAFVFIVIKVDRIDSKMTLLVKPAKRFSLGQIINQFPHNPDWEVQVPPETVEFVNMLTQQPFYWLGKGFQATAFVSEDGDYVIKFFHQSRLRPETFSQNPFGYMFSKDFHEKMDERQAHRNEIFTSSKMAYEEFPEESGILYVHLNRTDDMIKGIKLYDSSRQAYRFRGDEASFIVQKKADYVLPTIKALMANGQVEQAQARLDQIFDLLLSLAQKGFLDGDTALMRNNNIGFVADRAVYIDTGHITRHENVNLHDRMRYEFTVRLAPLHDWLKVRYPELAAYYVKRQQEMLASLPNQSQMAKNKLNSKEAKAIKTRQKLLNENQAES